MAGPPRSQALIQFESSGAGPSPVWTSPDGYVTLVKSLYVWQQTGADVVIQMVIRSASAGVAMQVIQSTVTTLVPFVWEGWLALNPGDNVYLYASGTNCGFWLSGAVLAGANQFPPATRETLTPLPA